MLRLILIISFLVSSFSIQAEKIPVETFFKYPDIASMRISPDGKHLAALVETNGVKKLIILDIKNLKLVQDFNFSREKQEIGSYGWLNNTRIYASMVQRAGPLSRAYSTGYLYSAEIDGTRKRQIMSGQYHSFLNMLKGEDKYILIAMNDGPYTSAYKLNVYSGHTKRVEKSPEKYSRLTADSSGDVRIAVSQDPDEEIIKIHLKNKEGEWLLFKELHEKSVNLNPLGFDKGNSKFIVELSDEQHPRGIYSLDLESKEFSLIKELPGDSSIQGGIYDNDYSNPGLIGVSRMPGYITHEYFDSKNRITRIHKSLKQSFPDEQVDFVNFTADGKTAVVRVWSDKNPGSYFLFDMEKYKLEFVIDVKSWIERKKMSAMEPIQFQTRDKLEIRGYLSRPNNKPENAPMVVLVHGGPYGIKDNWGYNNEVQFLTNRGYAVLQVNFRGSGGRGADFEYTNYRKMGKEMQNDITDATLWAIEQGYADKERICIFGASYGGYAALMGAIKEPDLYKCAIGYAGGYDIRAKKYADYYPTESGKKFVKEAWGYGDEAFIKERNVPDNVDKIKAALFLIHGKKDRRTPMENYDSLTDALEARNYPYESLLKTYEGHGFYKLENIVELYEKIEVFLDKHIGH